MGGRPRALTAEQALAVVSEAKRGVPQARIAQYFKVSQELVSRVVTGVSYADVTGVKRAFGTGPGQEPCCADSRCTHCKKEQARDRNLDAARAVSVDVECVACQSAICRTVGVVQSSHGLTRCNKCDGRRK